MSDSPFNFGHWHLRGNTVNHPSLNNPFQPPISLKRTSQNNISCNSILPLYWFDTRSSIGLSDHVEDPFSGISIRMVAPVAWSGKEFLWSTFASRAFIWHRYLWTLCCLFLARHRESHSSALLTGRSYTNNSSIINGKGTVHDSFPKKLWVQKRPNWTENTEALPSRLAKGKKLLYRDIMSRDIILMALALVQLRRHHHVYFQDF